MDTKEAIEFKESIKFRLSHWEEVQLNKILSLLKQGEAYRQMWEALENMDIEYKQDSPYVNDTMYYLEQKYLKEANPDEADNR